MRIPVNAPGDGGAFRPVARWLALATVLLILYGSLYPFRFSALGDTGFWELLRSLSFQRTSRSDIVANLLLYVPLGLCLTLAWPARWRRLTAFGWAVGAGVLLSLTVELLQVHAPARVSSLNDVLLNGAGTAAGAVLAVLYKALGRSIRIRGIAGGRPAPAPLGVVLLWLAFRLAPFIPSFDWAQYRSALRPVWQDPGLMFTDTFRYAVGWLVAGYAVRQVWRREFALPAVAALVAIVLLGRIAVVGKTLVAAELIGLAAAAVAGALLVMTSDHRRCAALAALLTAVVVVEGLQPFAFSATAHDFSWIPFTSSLTGALEVNYAILLEKCFWYFALVWLLARYGLPPITAALGTAILLAAIEFVQLWIPGRSAEITDSLLALAAGVLVALLGTGIYSKR
jgi:VanZ family protein